MCCSSRNFRSFVCLVTDLNLNLFQFKSYVNSMLTIDWKTYSLNNMSRSIKSVELLYLKIHEINLSQRNDLHPTTPKLTYFEVFKTLAIDSFQFHQTKRCLLLTVCEIKCTLSSLQQQLVFVQFSDLLPLPFMSKFWFRDCIYCSPQARTPCV